MSAKRGASTLEVNVVGDNILRIDLLGREVDVTVCCRSARRRRAAICLQRGRFEVRTPPVWSLRRAAALLQANVAWLEAQMRSGAVFVPSEEPRAPEGKRFFEGADLPLYGTSARLHFGARTASAERTDEGWRIALPCAADRPDEEIEPILVQLLKREALRTFTRLMAAWRPSDLPPEREIPFTLSNAKSRWGSCTRSGKIRLSWYLVFFDESLIEYVVAHEYAHLTHFDHSSRFWALLKKRMPDMEERRERLKALGRRPLPIGA